MTTFSKHMFLSLAVVVAAVMLSSCDNEEDVNFSVKATASGTFVDERDGFVYHYAQFGDTDWMLDNGHFNLKDATLCQMPTGPDEVSDRYLARYGYCYTLTGAKEACPEGWRVPTDEDWKKLEQVYGMSASEANSRGWRGNCAYAMRELSTDSLTFGALMTGYYTTYTIMQTPSFRLLGSFGFFWTSTPDETKENEYYYRKFAYNKKEVWRESTEDGHVMLFVRYCRDAKK